MRVDQMEQRFNNLEGRTDRIEQILPTLATKDDLQAAIEPLATKAELRAAIDAAVEPLATKVEFRGLQTEFRGLRTEFEGLRTEFEGLRTEFEGLRTELLGTIADSEQRMRTHFDVVTESLRDDIKLIAAAFDSLARRDR